MIRKLPFKEYQAIYSKVPRLVVDLVIKDSRGILLTLRNIEPKKGFWHFPGGTVLLGELVEQSIKRVALEELGLEVASTKFLGLAEYYKSDPAYFGHTISLNFLVKLKKGSIKLNEQASDVKYFKKLPAKMFKEQRELIHSKKLLDRG